MNLPLELEIEPRQPYFCAEECHAILFGRNYDMENTLSRESIIAEIQKDIARMQQAIELLGGVKTVSIDEVVKTRKPRRRMSAAGRRKIAAAQKARWARVRAGKK